MMKEVTAVKVVARARPLLPEEILSEQIPCLETVPEDGQIIVANEKGFNFDRVFNETSTQDDVYKQCISEVVNKVLGGYNATVLAYGQTGTGKTYTMGTDYNSSTRKPFSEEGIVPRVLNDIFDATQDTSETEYSIKVSFLEIYNKSVYDLLTKEKKQVQIQEQASGVKVPGLRVIKVDNVSDALHWLQEGCITRTTAATSMNLNSSRSHAVFTIYVHCIDNKEEQISKLHLVDLAGSETVHNNEASRFKEGVNINLGLLALERVISALCKGSQGNHVPYRSSALTHLLKDCLNEGSFTIMIICVSPAHSSMIETMNTLRYAARARCIKCKPIKNKFTHLENSVVKRKFGTIPQTPFTPYSSNRQFNLTMITPSLLPEKKPRLNSTIATPYCVTENSEPNSIPPPPRFSPSPNSKQQKLCALTEHDKTRNSISSPSFCLSPTATEETKMETTFQPDFSIMISPVVRKVCSQIDEAVGKKLENLVKRLEQMEDKRGVVFKQTNHTLLLTPLQTSKLSQLKKKIDESARKYFSPLSNESSFTPLRNRDHTSFALPSQVYKTPNKVIPEIKENISPHTTPGLLRRKSFTLVPSLKKSDKSIECKANNSPANIMKPPNSIVSRVLRERTWNSPNEDRRKKMRRRTTMSFCQKATVETRSKKQAISFDDFKGMPTVNKTLQKKHNKEVLEILNTGAAKDLQAIPLIGPKTTQILLMWRELKGPFQCVSDIKNVQGLSKTFFQRFIKTNLLTED